MSSSPRRQRRRRSSRDAATKPIFENTPKSRELDGESDISSTEDLREPRAGYAPQGVSGLLQQLRGVDEKIDMLLSSLRLFQSRRDELLDEIVKQAKDAEEVRRRDRDHIMQLGRARKSLEEKLDEQAKHAEANRKNDRDRIVQLERIQKSLEGKLDEMENRLKEQEHRPCLSEKYHEREHEVSPLVWALALNTDKLSPSELIEMIKELNKTIFFHSTVLSSGRSARDNYRVRVSATSEAVRLSQQELLNQQIVGKDTLRDFEIDSSANFRRLLGSVLQSCMSHLCKKIISSTTSHSNGEDLEDFVGGAEPYLKTAYRRAMIHLQTPNGEEAKWGQRAKQIIACALNVSGFHLSSEEILEGQEDRIHRIVAEALKINCAIMQRALWLQPEVLCFNANTPFDHSKMKADGQGAERVPQNTRILLSTSLGLALRTAKYEQSEFSFDTWETAVKVSVELPETKYRPRFIRNAVGLVP